MKTRRASVSRMEGRVHLNLLQWEEPVYGDLVIVRGGGVSLCVDGRCYNRVEAGGYTQWGMLARPATEFSRMLVGTQWDDLRYLRQSRILEKGDGFLTVEIVVNSPEIVHSHGACERMRMVRRVHTLRFFQEDGGAGSNASQSLSAAGTSEQVNTHETVRKNRRVSVRS